MNTREIRRTARRNIIVEIGAETEEVLRALEPTDDQIVDLVEECTGYKLTDIEKRLAIVAHNEGAYTAKRSVWYDW